MSIPTNEQTLLINILRERICENKVKPYENLSDEMVSRLYKLAASQDLTHIIADALQLSTSKNAEKLRKAFSKAQFQAIYRYVNINYAIEEIYKVFNENAIPYIPLKGAVLRDYYPEPEMRTSCDIDILIHEQDINRAVKCLESKINYTCDGRYTHDISLYSPAKVHLELHFRLSENNLIAGVLENVWDMAKQDEDFRYRYIMTSEHFVVYHIAHMAEHFIHGGCGIRNFLDLWIVKNRMGYNEKSVQSMLEKAGLSTFAKGIFDMTNVWFEQKKGTRITAEIENYIMSAGIYGTLENRVAILQSKKFGKTRYILRRVFIPFSQLKKIYPIIERIPILFPVYEVVRWSQFIFKKNKHQAISELKYNATVGHEKKVKLQKLMSDLNLKIS